MFPNLSYACETWTLKTDMTLRLEAFEMQCCCHLLNIKWQDHITNVEVLTRLGSFIKLQLLPMIRKCQTEWLGHGAHMSPNWLPNIALLGYTPGKFHCGHHPKRWIEDVLSHLNALRSAQDRKHWKLWLGDPTYFKRQGLSMSMSIITKACIFNESMSWAIDQPVFLKHSRF